MVASLQCYGCYAEWPVLLTLRLNRCNVTLSCLAALQVFEIDFTKNVYEMKSTIRLLLGLHDHQVKETVSGFSSY